MHSHIILIKVILEVFKRGSKSCLNSALKPIKNPINGNENEAIPYQTLRNLLAVKAPNLPSQF